MQKRLEDLGWWLLLALGLWLCTCLSASGQTQAFYANNVQDSTGAKLANGQVTVQPSSGSQPISYRFPGGGQGTMQVVAGNVVNGQFSLVLPDVAQTFPANVCFDVSVIDLSTNDTVLEDKCVQPSMTASYASNWCGSSYSGCDFDLFIPPIPGILPQNISGNVTYNYGSGEYVNVNSFPGADLGAQLAAADAAYTGQSKILAILTGGTIATQATLSASHGLAIYGPVTFNASITPTTGNTVQCYGGAAATLSNGMSPSSTNADGVNAFFFAGPGAAEVEHFTVRGCTFNGYGGAGSYIFDSDGPSQDVTLTQNATTFANLFLQGGAPPSNPSLRLTITNNVCDWSGSPKNPTAFCVRSNGALQDFLIASDQFIRPYYAVELYGQATDGKQAAGFPNASEIDSAGITNGIMTGNDVEGVFAGLWTSMSNRVTISANQAHGCDDYCYGVEAGDSNILSGNTAVNGQMAQEYGGYNNQFVGNTLVNGGFFNTAATTHSVYDHNRVSYPGSIGIFLYEESSDDHPEITGNNVYNGLMAYGTVFLSSQHVQGNTFAYDQTIPSSGIGSGAGCGLSIANFQDNLYSLANDNTLITAVPQTQPGICVGLSTPDASETVQLINDTLIGRWGTDVTLNSSSTNPAYQHSFELRGMEFSSGVVTATTNSGVGINVVCRSGGKGGAPSPFSIAYSLNGSSSQMSCN